MPKSQMKPMATAVAASVLGLSALAAAPAFAAVDHAKLDQEVQKTLDRCAALSPVCASSETTSLGTLVFPDVKEADLIVGGAGGRGALVEGQKIVGYYDVGEASVGLQAGIDGKSMVFVVLDPDVLTKIEQGGKWSVGAEAGVTVVDASANARVQDGSKVLAFVFDSKGLAADASVNVMKVWQTN